MDLCLYRAGKPIICSILFSLWYHETNSCCSRIVCVCVFCLESPHQMITKLWNKKPSCSYMTSRTKQLTGSDFRFCVTTSFIRALITFLDPDGDYILEPQAVLRKMVPEEKGWRFWESLGPIHERYFAILKTVPRNLLEVLEIEIRGLLW